MKPLFPLLVFLCLFKQSSAQDATSNGDLNKLLIQNFYSEYHSPVKRKVLAIKNKSIIAKLNPLIYLSAGLLFVYQSILSEQIQAECIYQTSCSSYTKFQIEKNGFRGFLLGFNQLNNCTPWAIYDYSACKITPSNKIINCVTNIRK